MHFDIFTYSWKDKPSSIWTKCSEGIVIQSTIWPSRQTVEIGEYQEETKIDLICLFAIIGLLPKVSKLEGWTYQMSCILISKFLNSLLMHHRHFTFQLIQFHGFLILCLDWGLQKGTITHCSLICRLLFFCNRSEKIPKLRWPKK